MSKCNLTGDLLDMSTTLKRTAEELMKEGENSSQGIELLYHVRMCYYARVVPTAVVKRAEALRKRNAVTHKSASSHKDVFVSS